MNSLKLLSLARKRDGLPTIKGPALNRSEQSCADSDVCVSCGKHPQTANSFRCAACETADTTEAIATDIATIRQRILNPHPGSRNG